MDKQDGGQAFPCIAGISSTASVNQEGKPILTHQFVESGGMSMRDYFAAHATEEDIHDFSHTVKDGTIVRTCSRVEARWAFADSMLAAREPKPN